MLEIIERHISFVQPLFNSDGSCFLVQLVVVQFPFQIYTIFSWCNGNSKTPLVLPSLSIHSCRPSMCELVYILRQKHSCCSSSEMCKCRKMPRRSNSVFSFESLETSPGSFRPGHPYLPFPQAPEMLTWRGQKTII